MQILVIGDEKYSSKYGYVSRYQTTHAVTLWADIEDAVHTARTLEADAIVVLLDKPLDSIRKRQLGELKGFFLIVVMEGNPLSSEEHLWIVKNLSAVAFHEPTALQVFGQIESILRFREKCDPTSFTLGDLTYDRTRSSIRTEMDEILLPRRECDILEILVRHRGVRLSKEQVASRIYGLKEYDASWIESHISKLRSKIRRISKVVDIDQRRFMGYTLYQRDDAESLVQEEGNDEPHKNGFILENALLSFPV